MQKIYSKYDVYNTDYAYCELNNTKHRISTFGLTTRSLNRAEFEDYITRHYLKIFDSVGEQGDIIIFRVLPYIDNLGGAYKFRMRLATDNQILYQTLAIKTLKIEGQPVREVTPADLNE
jgi:hypothetical protein